MMLQESLTRHLKHCYIKNLFVSCFRNYLSLQLNVSSAPVLLYGPNGAGKTNLLEAISLLAPGRGMRRASLGEISMRGQPDNWAISAEVHGMQGEAHIGTGRDPHAAEGSDKRIVRIDEKPARSQTQLAEVFNVLWLTPQMDNLFIEGGTARRKFFDRLVYSYNPDHVSHMHAYEQVMRDRNRLLETGQNNPIWLDALEHKMAEHGISIAVARMDTIEKLNHIISQEEHSFPMAALGMAGEIEKLLAEYSALSAEEKWREMLARQRTIDAAAGRTITGIHRTKINVLHSLKQTQAEHCSTGEQKALLVSIILAHAKAGMAWHGSVPVLLLDEVATHLDSARRCSLYDELKALGAQCWLTSTDIETFDGFEGQKIRLETGNVANPRPLPH